MIRRKWFAALVAAVMGMGTLFAQTAKYTELLNKAKTYEDKKEWCYALGYYYDAMIEDPANADEALTRYTAIADAIKEGKPGPGEYDEFALHDNWILLLQNTEKYWTEFCPKYFTFGEIEKGDVDFENHTASYSISMKSHFTNKFYSINECVEKGYKKAYRNDWKDMDRDWPCVSIYKASENGMQNGAAIYCFRDARFAFPAWYYDSCYCKEKLDYLGTGLYFVSFNICDKDGKELLCCNEYQDGNEGFCFDKVSADIMSLIDAHSVITKITDIYLKYGKSTSSYYDHDSYEKLQIKKMPVEQNAINIMQKNINDIVSLVPVAKKQKQIESYSPVTIDGMAFVRGCGKLIQDERKSNHTFIMNNFYISTTEVTQSQFQSVMGRNPSRFIGANLPVDCVDMDDVAIYCDKRSSQEGLTSCYSRVGNSWECNLTANGYRLPTEEEWEYAAKGGKDVQSFCYAGGDNIDEVAWYKGNSGGMTHDVATKKPNTLGIFDMSGNVWERCWNVPESKCVYCGGGFYSEKNECDVSLSCSSGCGNIGFRVVRSAQGITEETVKAQQVAIKKSEERKQARQEKAKFQEEERIKKINAELKENEVAVIGNSDIETFYISKTEITQEQYKKIMRKNPSAFRKSNHPVERVSWYDAVDYCNKRSEQEGLMPCYSGSGDNITCDFTANGYRLPTSEEWEYAAKGGKDVQSYEYAGSDSIDEVAWYGNNSGNTTHDVATKKPNTLGIYDMSGNVWEWCWTASGSKRVSRGGSYGHYDNYCTVSRRSGDDPSSSSYYLGFRVVRSSSVK